MFMVHPTQLSSVPVCRMMPVAGGRAHFDHGGTRDHDLGHSSDLGRHMRYYLFDRINCSHNVCGVGNVFGDRDFASYVYLSWHLDSDLLID